MGLTTLNFRVPKLGPRSMVRPPEAKAATVVKLLLVEGGGEWVGWRGGVEGVEGVEGMEGLFVSYYSV